MSAEETRTSDKREKDMKDNNNLPWGVLTGIRPSKIAAKLILGGMSERDAAQYFVDNYNASPSKGALAAEVAAGGSPAITSIFILSNPQLRASATASIICFGV